MSVALFHTQLEVLNKVLELVKNTPNDFDLGKEIRKLSEDYKNGKYTPPSDILFNNEEEK